MERITRTDLDRIVETINGSLRGVHLVVQGRNGHTCLDRYDEHGCIDMLHAGTKREVYTYLQGMRRALLITNRLDHEHDTERYVTFDPQDGYRVHKGAWNAPLPMDKAWAEARRGTPLRNNPA